MIDKFVAAFNARNLDGLKALLATDATAQVIGAPFPVERGADVIAATSLPHMLGGDERLSAESFNHDGKPWVLFRAPDGTLDTVATIAFERGLITRIEYFVTHFAAKVVAKIAKARGIAVRTDG